MALIILIIMSIVGLMWFSLTSKSIPLTCYMFILIYGISATFGSVLTLFLSLDTLPFGVGVGVSPEDHIKALLTFLFVMLAYLAGFKTFHRQLLEPKLVNSSNFVKSYNFNLRMGIPYIHLILFISVTTYAASYPDGGLYYRLEYLPNDINRTLKNLGQLMIFISIFLLMLKRGHKLAKIFWVTLTGLLFIGSASRSVLLIGVGYIFAKLIKNEMTAKKIAAVFVITMLALVLVMDFRGQSLHGLANYSLFELELQSFEVFIYALNYLSSFSYGLTATLISLIDYQESFFWISIDPRPGFMTEWSEISEYVRLNLFAPYNAISELYFMGAHYIFFYFFCAGLITGLLTSVSRKNIFINVIAVVVVFIFTIFSLQYNLRSATRYIYLELALLVIFFIWNNFKLLILSSKKNV